MSLRSQIADVLSQVGRQHNKLMPPLADDLPLLQSGLDSLCLAVVVARLEDMLNLDPFNTVEDVAFPVTVGDLIRLYESALAASNKDVCRSSVSDELGRIDT